MYSKATSYLDASQHLINTKQAELMSCSIAYSYYAVLQYMKLVLNNTTDRPINYDIQVWPEEDMHKRVLEEIGNRFKDYKKWKDLKERIRLLHEKRVEADYDEAFYSVSEAIDWRNEACALISILRNSFGNPKP